MISKKMTDRINLQINREMYSAFLYLAMAAAMKEKGYAGISKWLTVQYHEEMFHAMKFVKYLEEQGAAAKYEQIDKPSFKDGSVKEYFEQVLKHEQFVTSSIREMVELARAEKDYAFSGISMSRWRRKPTTTRSCRPSISWETAPTASIC